MLTPEPHTLSMCTAFEHHCLQLCVRATARDPYTRAGSSHCPGFDLVGWPLFLLTIASFSAGVTLAKE